MARFYRVQEEPDRHGIRAAEELSAPSDLPRENLVLCFYQEFRDDIDRLVGLAL